MECFADLPANEVVMDLLEFAVEEFSLTECAQQCDEDLVQRKTQFNQLRDDGSMERMPQHNADPTAGSGSVVKQAVCHPIPRMDERTRR